MKFLPIIGLEIHVELNTKSKMFCGCSAEHFRQFPNTHTCPICLGHPGTLPVPNKSAIEKTLLMALACGCKINLISKFDRKHYFYPDLPKGYQISQYDLPLGYDGSHNNIRIRRIHLEEDTAKLIHKQNYSLIDYNRAGVPLMEIVTEPDFHSAITVKIFLQDLQRLIRNLGISSADMEKGSMRLEINISLSKTNKLPNYKIEIKNLNSFRFVVQALDYEISRQTKILQRGDIPDQETRGYDQIHKKTFLQRKKEEAKDYRYFPEPDIPPLILNQNYLTSLKKRIPNDPKQEIANYCQLFQLTEEESKIIIYDPKRHDMFKKWLKIYPQHTPRQIALALINKRPIAKNKKSLYSEHQLTNLASEVINSEPMIIEDIQAGKISAIEKLIGEAMKRSQGKADARLLRQKLYQLLKLS